MRARMLGIGRERRCARARVCKRVRLECRADNRGRAKNKMHDRAFAPEVRKRSETRTKSWVIKSVRRVERGPAGTGHAATTTNAARIERGGSEGARASPKGGGGVSARGLKSQRACLRSPVTWPSSRSYSWPRRRT
eukprot:6193232-Pleurochrysis_carterae.AAC.3